MITDDLLQEGRVCQKCLENGSRSYEQKGVDSYSTITSYRLEVEDFRKLFSAICGSEPTSMQMTWAKRHLLGESLHIVAPYRSGKTTFGFVMSAFASIRQGKSALILTNEAESARLRRILSNVVRERRLTSEEQLNRVRLINISGSNELDMEESPGLVFVDEAFLLKSKLRGIFKKIVGPQTLIIAADSYVPVGTPSMLGKKRLNRIKVYSPLRRIKDFYVTVTGEEGLNSALAEVIDALGSKGIIAVPNNAHIQELSAVVFSSRGFQLQPLMRDDKFVILYITEEGDVLPPLSDHQQIHAKYVVFIGVPLAQLDEKATKMPDIRRYLEISSLASSFSDECCQIGLSIVLADDGVALKRLEESLRGDCDIIISPWNKDVVLDLLKKAHQKDEKTSDFNSGDFKQVLVLVESPTKARTISSFFSGAYSRRTGSVYKNIAFGGNLLLEVIATGGHVTDLSLTEGFHGVMISKGDGYIPVYSFIRRCKRCGSQFNSLARCPSCGSLDFVDKGDVVNVIRQSALVSDCIFIATDPDSEGEKIAWDLYVMLKPFNPNISRAEFHEITRYAFEEAIKSPRDISLNLVDAQISRRVEDRWVGFELSRRLWKRFYKKTLSAGRAQSPILNWIVNRTKENKEKLTYAFITLENGVQLRVSEKEIEDIKSFAKSAKGARAVIEELGEREVEVIPPPPYTTDSMLRDASFQLRMPSWLTMRTAQRLFELGLISYHRTDSTRVSPYGLAIARTYIEKKFGPDYYRGRLGGEAGAHEAIRATRPLDTEELLEALKSGKLNVQARLSRDEIRLYDLIFKRFVASQMTSAWTRVQRIRISLMGFETVQERRIGITEDGFMRLVSGRLEKRIAAGEYAVVQVRTRKMPKAWLFTEGDLISQMRNRGIGRPSTYSKLVETILKRRYAFEVNGRLISTELGEAVNEYLQKNYAQYVSEETTRELERKMKLIEDGDLKLQTFLSELHEEIRNLP